MDQRVTALVRHVTSRFTAGIGEDFPDTRCTRSLVYDLKLEIYNWHCAVDAACARVRRDRCHRRRAACGCSSSLRARTTAALASAFADEPPRRDARRRCRERPGPEWFGPI